LSPLTCGAAMRSGSPRSTRSVSRYARHRRRRRGSSSGTSSATRATTPADVHRSEKWYSAIGPTKRREYRGSNA